MCRAKEYLYIEASCIMNYSDIAIRFFESNGAKLAIREVGEGCPLVLVRGWPVTGYIWRFLIPALSQHFKCYILDLPGLGDSDWNDKTDFYWEVQADRIVDLISSEGISEVSLIANDRGGAIARLVAIELKQKVKHLILTNAEIPNLV